MMHRGGARVGPRAFRALGGGAAPRGCSPIEAASSDRLTGEAPRGSNGSPTGPRWPGGVPTHAAHRHGRCRDEGCRIRPHGRARGAAHRRGGDARSRRRTGADQDRLRGHQLCRHRPAQRSVRGAAAARGARPRGLGDRGERRPRRQRHRAWHAGPRVPGPGQLRGVLPRPGGEGGSAAADDDARTGGGRAADLHDLVERAGPQGEAAAGRDHPRAVPPATARASPRCRSRSTSARA